MTKSLLDIVTGSELFDPDWYCATYPIVSELGISPAEHYMRFGARLRYDPGPDFSTHDYERAHADVRAAGVPALLHYETSGRAEGRAIRPPPTALCALARALKQSGAPPALPSDLSCVSVIVPVFNGHDHLVRLLPRLIANTPTTADIIIIDDASTDPRIGPLIQTVSDHDHVRVLTNARNLGFAGSVNKAAALARAHFCLLNSDTDVPPAWLERLMAPILRDETVIATTTPFSNAATLFSFPTMLVDNPPVSQSQLDALDALFQHVPTDPGLPLSCPTGVGFCMGVNGQVWRSIGGFDEAAFGRGYGEENDWCQRAAALGFDNVLVPNLYVLHAHGGSFPSDEKQTLIARNGRVLAAKWPQFDRDVQDAIARDPWRDIRAHIIARSAINMACVLVVDHGLGGGANSFSEKNRASHLAEGKAVFCVFFDGDINAYRLHIHALGGVADVSTRSIKELFNFLNSVKFKEMEINNFVNWPNIQEIITFLAKLIETNKIKTKFFLHDFFAICPVYTLVDHSGQFCNVPSDPAHCTKCIHANAYTSERTHPVRWRMLWHELMSRVGEIQAFSPSSAALFHRAFGTLADRLKIVPHVPLAPLRKPKISGQHDVTIGVFGNINVAKGAESFKRLVQWVEFRHVRCRFVHFGKIEAAFEIQSDWVTYSGPYAREDMPDLIEQHQITCCWMPSICPETFSYVTQELIMMDMPVACFDLGGQADQVRGYRRGRIITDQSPEAVWSALVALTDPAILDPL